MADPNLSGTRFYCLADPAILPVFVAGYINGETGPRIKSQRGWVVDGLQLKVELDWGVGAIDYRGAVTGAGS